MRPHNQRHNGPDRRKVSQDAAGMERMKALVDAFVAEGFERGLSANVVINADDRGKVLTKILELPEKRVADAVLLSLKDADPTTLHLNYDYATLGVFVTYKKKNSQNTEGPTRFPILGLVKPEIKNRTLADIKTEIRDAGLQLSDSGVDFLARRVQCFREMKLASSYVTALKEQPPRITQSLGGLYELFDSVSLVRNIDLEKSMKAGAFDVSTRLACLEGVSADGRFVMVTTDLLDKANKKAQTAPFSLPIEKFLAMQFVLLGQEVSAEAKTKQIAVTRLLEDRYKVKVPHDILKILEKEVSGLDKIKDYQPADPAPDPKVVIDADFEEVHEVTKDTLEYERLELQAILDAQDPEFLSLKILQTYHLPLERLDVDEDYVIVNVSQDGRELTLFKGDPSRFAEAIDVDSSSCILTWPTGEFLEQVRAAEQWRNFLDSIDHYSAGLFLAEQQARERLFRLNRDHALNPPLVIGGSYRFPLFQADQTSVQEGVLLDVFDDGGTDFLRVRFRGNTEDSIITTQSYLELLTREAIRRAEQQALLELNNTHLFNPPLCFGEQRIFPTGQNGREEWGTLVAFRSDHQAFVIRLDRPPQEEVFLFVSDYVDYIKEKEEALRRREAKRDRLLSGVRRADAVLNLPPDARLRNVNEYGLDNHIFEAFYSGGKMERELRQFVQESLVTRESLWKRVVVEFPQYTSATAFYVDREDPFVAHVVLGRKEHVRTVRVSLINALRAECGLDVLPLQAAEQIVRSEIFTVPPDSEESVQFLIRRLQLAPELVPALPHVELNVLGLPEAGALNINECPYLLRIKKAASNVRELFAGRFSLFQNIPEMSGVRIEDLDLQYGVVCLSLPDSTLPFRKMSIEDFFLWYSKILSERRTNHVLQTFSNRAEAQDEPRLRDLHHSALRQCAEARVRYSEATSSIARPIRSLPNLAFVSRETQVPDLEYAVANTRFFKYMCEGIPPVVAESMSSRQCYESQLARHLQGLITAQLSPHDRQLFDVSVTSIDYVNFEAVYVLKPRSGAPQDLERRTRKFLFANLYSHEQRSVDDLYASTLNSPPFDPAVSQRGLVERLRIFSGNHHPEYVVFLRKQAEFLKHLLSEADPEYLLFEEVFCLTNRESLTFESGFVIEGFNPHTYEVLLSKTGNPPRSMVKRFSVFIDEELTVLRATIVDREAGYDAHARERASVIAEATRYTDEAIVRNRIASLERLLSKVRGLEPALPFSGRIETRSARSSTRSEMPPDEIVRRQPDARPARPEARASTPPASTGSGDSNDAAVFIRNWAREYDRLRSEGVATHHPPPSRFESRAASPERIVIAHHEGLDVARGRVDAFTQSLLKRSLPFGVGIENPVTRWEGSVMSFSVTLRKLFTRHEISGRVEITDREIRLDPVIPEALQDNKQALLKVLREELQKLFV